jgi:patatin-related protein
VREKELRIALVCFGGVSLAVYMHGVTKEVLKLVRASSALHALPDVRRAGATFFEKFPAGDPEYDSEAVYFEVLRDIGREIGLRVVVDILAGASAGGINAALLARALSHDLPMGRLRDLWLDRGDVGELLAPEARASAYSKWFLKPAEWAMTAMGGLQAVDDAEARRNLSLFLRSRWFKPPLSGERMAAFLYDALLAMEAPRDKGASLLPSGHMLDLFVTLTDHYGYQRPIHIHDPPLIHEREHRHVVRFRYRRRASGEVRSDFDLGGIPALAFAARATSSFPGAFPPAQIAEIDRLLAERGVAWPRRGKFIERNFAAYTRFNIDPASAWFVDGSVLNNRPFRQAIAAIEGRPAYRQVDRRLVYVDPDPAPRGAPTHRAEPGFFAMLKGALTDLPSAEPVADELNWVDEFNERVDRLLEIIEDARPRISRRVALVADTTFEEPIDVERVRAWREQASLAARTETGFAHEGYVHLRLGAVRGFVAGLIAEARGVPVRSPLAQLIAQAIDVWADTSGLVCGGVDADQPWVGFLRGFDIAYCRRRLHFMIQGQNRLYQRLDQPAFAGVDREAVDRLKRRLYDRLDEVARRGRAPIDDPSIREMVEVLFPQAPAITGVDDARQHARRLVERRRTDLDRLMACISQSLDLVAEAHALDGLAAELDSEHWRAAARREVFVNYLGFPFWDVLTLPIMTWRESGEFNRILVDRLSPQDAHSLGRFSGPTSLRGTRLGHFAGFLSRAYRENDYLLGRLHAFDRLVDIVCDCAGFDVEQHKARLAAWKKKGFLGILDAEEAHLPNSGALLAALRRYIDELAG